MTRESMTYETIPDVFALRLERERLVRGVKERLSKWVKTAFGPEVSKFLEEPLKLSEQGDFYLMADGFRMHGEIWKNPRIQEMLRQPVGTPINLTREEAVVLAREAFGSRPDLPPGEEYVRMIQLIPEI